MLIPTVYWEQLKPEVNDDQNSQHNEQKKMIFLRSYFRFCCLNMNYLLLADDSFQFILLLSGCLFLSVRVETDEFFVPGSECDDSSVKIMF